MQQLQMSDVEEILGDLVAQAKEAFGESLKSVVLFGSAAEQRLRPSSDVNLLLVLDRFETMQADAYREALRAAGASIRAKAMFVLAQELPVAAQLFALKFYDIQLRHRLLYGADPIANLIIDREELKRRLREVLLNLSLRLRERYIATSLQEESLQIVLAEAAGPLRSAAAAMLRLQSNPPLAPRDALIKVAASYDNKSYTDAVESMSQARQKELLPAGQAKTAMLTLIDLACQMRQQLEAMS